jgi:phage FluMu gp28-like protein
MIQEVMVDEPQQSTTGRPDTEARAPQPDAKHLRVPATVRPIVPLLAYQREDVESEARFNWCCWSRQIGKSFTKSLRRILRGLMRGRTQVFLSAGERQSRELMLKARQHCQALAIAAEFHGDTFLDGTEFKHLEISLPNGVRIIGLPANPQTVRGFTGDVFLDEFAMHRDDREIWAAVFPTVLRGDGELDVASTPKGPSNLFAELRGNAEFRHSTVTLYGAIEQGLDLDAEQIRRSMHDDSLFRQEFLCEFLDEVGAFLTYEEIAACEDGTLDLPVRLGATKGQEDLTQRREEGETRGHGGAGTRRHGDAGLGLLQKSASSLRTGCFVGVDVGRRRDLTVMWVLGGSDEATKGRSDGGKAGRSDAGNTGGDHGAAEVRREGGSGGVSSFLFHPPCPPLLRGGEADALASRWASSAMGGDVLTTLGVIEMRDAPFREQYDVLRQLLGMPAVRRCCIDATGVGMAMAEAAQEEFGAGCVEAVTFTPGMKDRLATGLKRRFEDRTIRVPADEAIRNDLHSVRWDVTAGGAGRFLVAHESDSHADRFWGLALAIRAAESAGPVARVEYETVRGLRFARAGIW